ncbi:MAG: tqsA 2 [Bacteroidetes bacterium]|jgi:predicted PurR-regulated permease PerM|nr:tqsA 2 [Bacteroidota bacterium]
MKYLPGNNISAFLQITLFSAVLLYLGRALLIPMSFGLLLAIVAYPLCKILEKKKWPRGLAVMTLITAIILIFVSLLWLLVYEANLLVRDLPLVEAKLQTYSNEISSWFNTRLGIGRNAQDKFNANLESYFGSALSGTISATSSTAVTLFLIPIFGALFLFHRHTFVRFTELLIGNHFKGKLNSILQESIVSYYRFVRGTFFVYCIVGILNSVGLLLLGIEHAFLFGIVTAFMTVIPYVGIIISAALPVAVALITKDSVWYAVGVVIVFSVVQYLEANLIFPKIVGRQLGLSTWAVIVAMIIGTLLWGLAGMILFTPFAAILKIFSDNTEELRIINVLLTRDAKNKRQT